MKGTNVDPQEIDNVRKFLANSAHASHQAWSEDHDEEVLMIKRADVVRLIAWYGAIRAHGRAPGELFKPDTGEKI